MRGYDEQFTIEIFIKYHTVFDKEVIECIE